MEKWGGCADDEAAEGEEEAEKAVEEEEENAEKTVEEEEEVPEWVHVQDVEMRDTPHVTITVAAVQLVVSAPRFAIMLIDAST
ncbi:hypothetical protein FN846DRAFT_906812 [Sphaerosporella brunnea]|uniref:Uncharacterized protein n=1 Tax=Sphaerosporella brunnea TaxID=1250544 RepID=A0A5J5EXZ2_9PEZI|nr:hypothetical protein FN846DRAFT_906812 [Sphaerosporella brunnea]